MRKFGENQSGAASCDRFAAHFVRATLRFASAHSNAAHLVLLVLFCAASPESVFAKVMPLLERVAAVSALEDHASDAALAKPTAADAGLGKNRLWRSPRGNDMFNVSQVVESGAGVVATTVLAKSAYAKHLRSNSISLEV